MERLTPAQRLQIVQLYYENSRSVRNVFRGLRSTYGQHHRPTEPTIRNTIAKLETQFTLLDDLRPNRPHPARSAENIAAVADSVREDREESIRHRSQQLGLSYATTWRILRRDLGLKAYKIQLVQELKPTDMPNRYRFSVWALEKLEEDPLFSTRILFSDEAHFTLNGHVNKHNCRIWGEEQPEQVQELPLHPLRTTVWCGLWAGGIIGPYFFRNEAGRNVTVNGDRYREMITDWLVPEIEARDLDDIWFQQDGASCHVSRLSMALLRRQFGEQLISRNGPVKWPPRSCDITPLDFFLWGYLKSKVYANKPATIDALEANITREIAAIQVPMLERVIENWNFRMDHLKRSYGQHLKGIIFKK
ncbi:uncharacterized protein LOC129572772 [Sitodiplosis mosellana]|uniref:uncharacterized protein LOC129572772 n=2 Tax=Sitodiplosis mosellana TaxID=263140 RepID=UPI0024442BED|nr:uncharacterized protein LOC129572772 [Sitodiplosis mosellana]